MIAQFDHMQHYRDPGDHRSAVTLVAGLRPTPIGGRLSQIAGAV